MAKAQKSKDTKKTSPGANEIVIQQITVAQLERGNQTIQTWVSNVRSAERVLNPNWRYLFNTYLDIDIDLHLDSVVDKRIRALKNVPFEWPTLEDGRIKDNLQSPWFYQFLSDIGKSIFWGYGVEEFVLGDDGLIAEAVEIPRQNIVPHKKLIVRRSWGDESGAFPYTEPPYNNYMLEIGKPTWLGKYMKIAPLVLLKRGNLSDFARFNEMFGFPMRIYEYDPHDPTARSECEKQAKAHGAAAYIIMPKGTTVQLADANKGGSQEAFSKLHQILNDEITIGVLGQTLTTSTTGVGSNALGKVHSGVELDIALEDRTMVELLINYSFRNNILIPHGYPLQDVKGCFKLTEEVEMEKKINMWLMAIDRGVQIAEEDFYEEFGIPFPGGRPVIVPVNRNPNPGVVPLDPDEEPDGPKPGTPPKGNPEGNGEEESGEDGDENGNDGNKKGNGGDKKGKSGGTSGKKTQLVSDAVRALYLTSCGHGFKPASLALSYKKDLADLIEEIIRRIYSGEIQPGDVSPELWELISTELNRGVLQGFKGVKPSLAHEAMLQALTRDVQVFSGFKTYQMLREATNLLVDPVTHSVRPFARFRDEILKLNAEYNLNFLRAEYNHAIGAARMAGKWSDITEKASVLPLLQYITAGDARVRESHRRLDGITLPIDHWFWKEYMPPNDWNCRCNVKQLPAGEQSVVKREDLPQLKESFKFNPGLERVIFPRNHPYYQVQAEDQARADDNFGLPIE